MSDESLAIRFAGHVMQRCAYELSDIMQKYPPELHVFCVAAMKSTAAAIEAQLDETDRQLLSVLMERTNCVVMPTAFDPRRQERE